MRLKAAILFSAFLVSSTFAFAVEKVTPLEAARVVYDGQAVLIDIRTPGEWADTGIAKGAMPLDMTSPSFINDLKSVITANPDKKLAFICRSGNRSNMLTRYLEQNGLQNTMDVTGGMRQWIGSGLPVGRP